MHEHEQRQEGYPSCRCLVSGRLAGGSLYRGLKERGVLVRWWAGSGRIEDFVRITVGSMEQLRILTAQIEAILKEV